MTSYIYNMVDTWASGGGPYTSIKMNATDNDVGSASLLMDLQVGGASRFSVSKAGFVNTPSSAGVGGFGLASELLFTRVSGYTGLLGPNGGAGIFFGAFGSNSTGTGWAAITSTQIRLTSTNQLAWSSSPDVGIAADLFLTRRGTANLRLGAADAAAPVAQTLSVQSGTAGASALSCSISGTTLTVGGAVTGTIAIGHAVTGTGVSAGTVITAGSGTTWTVNNSQTVSSTTMYFNSVGQNLTITGSQGSGPSAGGSIVFQVAPAGSAATTAQNALATALTIGADRNATFDVGVNTPVLRPTPGNDLIFNGASVGAAWRITTAGHFIAGTDNTYDIGASGANRPRNVYVANNITIGGTNITSAAGGTWSQPSTLEMATGGHIRWASRSRVYSTADGVIALLDSTAAAGSSLEMSEMTAPAAPATNGVRIYAEDNGSGKTRLMARFATGAAVQIAIEP